MSSPTKGSLNEMESKITALETANFDLKMQLYYLTQKQTEKSTSRIESEEIVVVNEDVDTDPAKWELIQLREEQEYSRRRLKELEEEILQLQIIRDSDIEKAAKLKPVNMVLIDENRKQERDAAAAIAAHDAAVIKQLQEEIIAIQKQHELDKQLINESAQKMAMQLQAIDEKDAMIFNLSGSLDDFKRSLSDMANRSQPTDAISDSASPTTNHTDPTTPGSVLYHGADISHEYYRNEIDRMRNENEILRDQLKTQKESINNQQEALLKMSRTQHEMAMHLEGEEVKRLQSELDRCIEEKVVLVQRNVALDAELQVLHTQLLEERPVNHTPVKSQGSGSDAPADELLKTIEMYRRREVELLNALEGVVARCQELEAIQY